MPYAVLRVEHAINKIRLTLALMKSQHATYRLYYAGRRLRAKAEHDVVQALYRDAGAHDLDVGKQDVAVFLFEVFAYLFAVLHLCLPVGIENRLLGMQLLEFLE